jgi:hypothetical protein
MGTGSGFSKPCGRAIRMAAQDLLPFAPTRRRTAKLDDAAKFQPCPKMLLNRARRRDLR